MFLCTVYVKWSLIINIKEHASILSIFLKFLNFEGLFKEDCFITSFFLYLNCNYFVCLFLLYWICISSFHASYPRDCRMSFASVSVLTNYKVLSWAPLDFQKARIKSLIGCFLKWRYIYTAHWSGQQSWTKSGLTTRL